MEYKQESSIAINVLSIVSSRFVTLISSFMLTVVLLRILTLESYGIFGLFVSCFSLGLSLSIVGIDTALVRLISKNPEKNAPLIGQVCILILIISAFAVTFFYFFMDFSSKHVYRDPGLFKYLIFAALGLPFGIFSTILTSFLQGLSEIKKVASITVISRISGLFIAIFLIFKFSLMGAVFAYILFFLIDTILSIFIIFQIKNIKNLQFSFRPTKESLMLIIKPGIGYYTLTIINMFTFWFGLAILDIILGHHAVGVYQVGQYIFAVLQQIGISFVFVLFPRFSSMSENKILLATNLENAINKTIKFSFSIQLILGVVLIVLQDVLLFVFDLKDEVGISITLFITIGPIILGIGLILVDAVLYGMSRFKELLLIKIAFFLSYISSELILISVLGYVGLILSLFIGWIFQIGIAFLFIQRIYTKKTLTHSYLYKPAIILIFHAILYLTTIVMKMYLPNPINILSCFLMVIITTLFTFYYVLDNKDRLEVKEVIKTSVNRMLSFIPMRVTI
jgi:PST family polysaccharide transporter